METTTTRVSTMVRKYFFHNNSFVCTFRGANIESKDKDNYTPLLVAVAQGNEDSVSALLENDANIRAKESSDKSAIFIAAEENCIDVLEVIYLEREGILL